MNRRHYLTSFADPWMKSVLGSTGKFWIASLLLLTIASVQTRGQANQLQGARPTTKPSSSQPIAFEKNRNQADSGVKFLGRGLRHTLLLTQDEAILTGVLQKEPENASQSLPANQAPMQMAALGMKFSGANPSVKIAGEALLPGKIYHADAYTLGPLSGNDTFQRVKYSGIYSGVDAVFYGTDGRFEFDFLVAPHADANQIRLSFSGAEKIRLLETGEISLQLAGEDVRLKKPRIYQESNGIRREIEGGYTIRDGNDVALTVGDYDTALSLTIDPVIAYGTYVGNSQDNGFAGIAVNQSGETYVLGLNNDATTLQAKTTFPVSTSGPDTGFLTKISADGSTALYTVVFSGISDFPILAVDSQDNVQLYLGGPDNALRTLSKDSTGALTLGLFHGSFVFPNGPTAKIQTDSKGNAYLVIFYQPGGPTTAGYYLFKVDPNGQVLGTQLIVAEVDNASHFTFENVTGLTVNDQDQAFVIGMVGLSTIATTPNAFQSIRQDSTTEDAFAMQIDTTVPNNFQVRYATYLGGSGDDRATGIGLSSTGAMLITGTSTSANFPTTPNTFQAIHQNFGGTFDTYLLKLDPTGQTPSQQLVFSTWLGHESSQSNSLVVLPGDLPTIAGTAPDFNFPLDNSFYGYAATSGVSRSYVTTFSANGSRLLFSSFLDPGSNPGTGFSIVPALATDGSQFLYVSTVTNESGQGTAGAFQSTYAGGAQFLLRKIDLTDVLPLNNPPQVTLSPSVNVTATSPSGGLFNLGCGSLISCSYVDPDGDRLKSFTWTGPNGFTATSSAAPPNSSVLLPIGIYTFTLAVQDVRGGVGTASMLVTVLGTNTDFGSGTVTPVNDDLFDVQQGLVNPVTVTFDDVTSPGLTWVTTRVDQNPPAPVDSQTGLPLNQAGSPPTYFDVHTNAGFFGVAHVCIETKGMSFADPINVQVYEVQQAGNWVALSTTPQGSQLCADTSFPLSGPVDQLSTMAIFYPPVPATAITTIAGNGFSPGQLDGNPTGGQNSQDNFVDGGPAAQQAIGQPFGGAVDVQNKYVYFSSTYLTGGALYKLDLNTGSVNRIAGTGFRPFGNSGAGDIPTDGASSLQYPLNQPGAVAVDFLGNVYIAEHIHAADNALALESCAILKLDIGTHTISRVAGSEPAPRGCGFSGDGSTATSGLIGEIRAIAQDIFGHVFLADADNHRVRRVDAFSGTISTVAGDGGSESSDGNPKVALQTSLLGTIGGLAFDSQGNLVISERHLWRLAPSPSAGLIGGNPDEILTPIQQCGFIPLPQCKPLPFGGDGGPVGNTTGAVGGSIIVASDGSIVTVQDQRVRQALPGTDHIVTGNDNAEIIQTIGGYEYDATLPQFGGNGTPGAGFFNGDMYATNSSLASPAGVLEDPRGGFLILDTNNRRIRRVGIPIASGIGGQTADLSISATASPNPTNSGDVLSYGTTSNPIVITNLGPAGATGVIFNFNLPTTANFENVTTSQGTCSTPALGSTGTVNCDLGAIVNGGIVTLTVAVRPQAAGPLAATLSVLGNETDTNPANNLVNVSTTINLGSVTVNVTEAIQVTDTPTVLPSAMIVAAESITVTDTPNVLPSAMIQTTEAITVTDAPGVQPSVLINASEGIVVTDTPTVTPGNLPPAVTAPAGITIGATELGGARGDVSSTLHSFLLGGTAVDGTDPSPQRLNAQANLSGGLADVNDQSLFPVGVTVVTFAFRDAAGATGSATSTVTVAPPVGTSVSAGPAVTVTPTDANNVPQPMQLTFSSVTQPGLITATQIIPPPSAPTGTKFVNSVFDIETTALFTPPITVCFLGTGFLPGDQIWHNGVLLTTTVNTPTMICAQTPSLSPFGVVRAVTVNNPPSANAGPDQILEATSAAGAQVTLSGKGTDPDNDPLTFAWTSATCGSANGQTVSLACPLGVNTVSLTVSDGRGGTGTDSAIVTVRDTTPPALKLPTNITVEATGPKGTTVSYSASAIDLVSGAVAPVCLPASGTAFPFGSTTVKCTAKDAAGNSASGNFTVTARDTTPPSITITPSQVTVIVSSVPATRAALGLPSPVVSDLVDPNPHVTDNAPSTFSTGAFAIVFTATDASGNKSTTTLNVNVQLRFASFAAEAIATQVRPANSDLFAANLSIQLGKGNNGINVSTDSFHLQVTGGAASLTIDVPFSKFHAGLLGSLVFSGNINNMPTDITLIPSGSGRYDIVVGVAKASLTGLTNPLTFNATLGSDTGQVTTAVVILKK